MPKVHSHYENLKVARDAPPEVIRAAYRSLSQKYHPDRNPGNAEAARAMTLINAAYDTLSDPVKRKEHDKWIAKAEADDGIVETNNASGNTGSSERGRPFTVDESKLKQHATPQSTTNNAKRVFAHVLRNWFWYGIGTIVVLGWINDKPKPPLPGPKPYVATPTPSHVASSYVKPATAPNGQSWPATAAYMRGYQRLHTDGLSTVSVDNSRNDSDVFVKLVSLDGPRAYPVRIFYIPAHGRFTLNNVSAGNYDIRYRDLNSGGLSRSEAFSLEETPTYNGTQFSNITMTLYKVRHGNMQTYRLSETEF